MEPFNDTENLDSETRSHLEGMTEPIQSQRAQGMFRAGDIDLGVFKRHTDVTALATLY